MISIWDWQLNPPIVVPSVSYYYFKSKTSKYIEQLGNHSSRLERCLLERLTIMSLYQFMT